MDLHVFTTGGTIDKVYFDAKSDYEVGEPQIAQILREEANVTIDYEVTTLLRKDSLDMTEADRELVAEHVKRTESRHIVITHGTDTMVQTGRVLKGVAESKTIVLVGSLNPARFKDTDAVFNIGFAVAAAQTLPPGVYVAMNGQIFDPEDVRKNREANQFERVESESSAQ
jgi:L-asparaginase